jgi:hypothetical protein
MLYPLGFEGVSYYHQVATSASDVSTKQIKSHYLRLCICICGITIQQCDGREEWHMSVNFILPEIYPSTAKKSSLHEI